MDSRHDIRIARNSLYAFARGLIGLPVLLILTPYTIGKIGIEKFGIWGLAAMLSSYVQLSDFGMTESLIKFFAESHAREDSSRTNRLLNTALVLATVLSLVGFSILLTFMDFIVSSVLSIPRELIGTAKTVFSLSLAIFSLNMMFSVFSSLVVGFQRMDISNGILAGATFLNVAGTVIFLEAGYGIDGLVYSNAIATVAIAAGNWLASRSLFHDLRVNPFRHFSRDEARTILSFGWKVQLSGISQILIFQIDRILLSRFVGLSAVGYYEIAIRIASAGRGVIISAFSPIIPAASSMDARNEHDLVEGMYRRGMKYMAGIAFPAFLLLAGLAHPLIRTLMGEGYSTSAYSLQFLSVIFILNLLTGPGAFVCSGVNMPHLPMRSAIMAGCINVCLCLPLVLAVGYYGVLAGIFLSILLSGIYFIRAFHAAYPGIDMSVYRTTLLRPGSVSLALGTILALLDVRFHFTGYSTITLLLATTFGIYVAAIYTGDFLDDFDRNLIRSILPKRWGGR